MSELALMPIYIVGIDANSQAGGLLCGAFVGRYANMEKQALLQAIKAQLKAKGISAAEASQRAVGNPYLVTNMGRDRYGLPSTENLISLCNVLDLEFYVGPPRDVGPVQSVLVDGEEFASVPLHDALLAAGCGVLNGHEGVVERIAFRRDWLRRIGTSPSNAVLARVTGDSMEPTIWAGDMILIDLSKKDIPVRNSENRGRARSPIYAFLDDGDARVKRVERLEENQLILLSDNPEYAPQLVKSGSVSIVGKVVWWGHTARE